MVAKSTAQLYIDLGVAKSLGLPTREMMDSVRIPGL
jgi:hypothetical protein